MKFLYAVILLIIVACSCGAVKEQKEIKGIKYSFCFPRVTMQGKLIGYDTVVKFLYFYDNQVFCNFIYRHDSFENNTFITSEWKHVYFTFSKGSKYGLIFSDTNNKKAERVSADSMLKLHWPTIHADSALSEKRNNVKFIDKSFNADSGILTERYEAKNDMDTATRVDLILRYSNKINVKEYSFSRKLDSLRQMKLYFFKMTVKPRYFGKENYLLDSFDTIYFFEEIPVTNKEELMYYFKQGQKMDSN
ncbi:MAG: hypothetical protein V4685_16990 [Bacteroidota bacterium]